MNNSTFIGTETDYNEVAIAMNDYKYGDTVQFFIPALMSLIDNKYAKSISHSIIKKNIMNKDSKNLVIGDIVTGNYINLYVPLQLADYNHIYDYVNKSITDSDNRISEVLQFAQNKMNEIKSYADSRIDSVIAESPISSSGINMDAPDLNHDIKNPDPQGKAGDKFIVSFAGGNINECKIIGRI